MQSSSKASISTKWFGLGIVLIFLIGVSAFIMGSKTANNSISQIADTFKSIGQTQSSYDKCMYQCMDGHTEPISYCKPYIKDFIDNYNKYYDPFSVSSAFEDVYIDKTKQVSQENGIMIACFRFVVGCRVNVCKDYL